MHIVKKLGAHVCVGSDRFKVGQGEWEMMTFNETHRWIFPWSQLIALTLNWMSILGELRKAEIEVLQMREILVGIWRLGKLRNPKIEYAWE